MHSLLHRVAGANASEDRESGDDRLPKGGGGLVEAEGAEATPPRPGGSTDPGYHGSATRAEIRTMLCCLGALEPHRAE